MIVISYEERDAIDDILSSHIKVEVTVMGRSRAQVTSPHHLAGARPCGDRAGASENPDEAAS